MRVDWIIHVSQFRARIVVLAEILVLAASLTIGFVPSAQALPSFARQTGQPCGTCHTDFPALTPYGRRFKLLGYTTGGGEFRTNPFSSQIARDARAEYDKMMGYVKALPPQAPSSKPEEEKEWVPPVSMMAVVGYTHTQADLGTLIGAPPDPYSQNNNVVLSPFSAFWGGAITDNIGAFAQVTYNAIGPGPAADPFDRHTWTWDNTFDTPTPPTSDRSISSTASPPTTIRRCRTSGTPRRRGASHTPCRMCSVRKTPALCSKAPSLRMSAASALMPSSTTCFISN
jgi:hypothetical protein